MDPHGNDDGYRDDAAILTNLHVGGIQPDVGPVALKGPLQEGLNLTINLFTEPGYLAFGDATIPMAWTRSSTDRVEMPCT